MASKRVLTVFGATGAQGSGLVRAALEDGEFAVRAVTRNPKGAKGEELQKQGAEVVAADLDDPASLVAALKGSYGAFFVTNYWEHMSAEKELQQAKNLAHAAKDAGLKHAIWSTLEDTRKDAAKAGLPKLHGDLTVPHFDAKGQANQFFIDSGVPYTLLHTSFYWNNFLTMMKPQKDDQGRSVITMPLGSAKMAGIDVEDIGRCAYGIFKAGAKYQNKSVGIAGDHLSGQEMADILTKATGHQFVYNAVPWVVYAKFGFPGADDLANMFRYYEVCSAEFSGLRPVAESRAMNPQLKSFQQFVDAHLAECKAL